MRKQWCVNGELDDTQYSSPVPSVGFYIGLASLMCFISILCDVFHAIRRRKPWVPCKFFSLNSFTLTLISIATKLSVDLTTKMPSSHDQLSKLTGTAFICICMGYFLPSLGTMSKSEGLSNMAALTVTVIAIILNICIQIRTGVIFSFIIEHIITLSFMLLLLVLLWHSLLTIDSEKHSCMKEYRQLLDIKKETEMSPKSLKQKITECYVHSYVSNPQLLILQTSHSASIGVVCLCCASLLSKAVFRSLLLKEEGLIILFCKGDSDYGRSSVSLAVAVQILHVLAGTLVANIRWLTLIFQQSLFAENNTLYDSFCETSRYWIYESDLRWRKVRIWFPTSLTELYQVIECDLWRVLLLIQLSFLTTDLLVASIFVSLKGLLKPFITAIFTRTHSHRDSSNGSDLSTLKSLKFLASFPQDLRNWLLLKSVQNIKRWDKLNKRDPPNHLNHLLSHTQPSFPNLPLVGYVETWGLLTSFDFDKDGYFKEDRARSVDYRVSCLSLVILVFIAAGSIPSSLSDSLIHALDEVFEIVYFIDEKTNVATRDTKMIFSHARTLWANRKKTLYTLKRKYLERKQSARISLDRALESIVMLKGIKNQYFILLEVGAVGAFMKNIAYESIEDLGDYVKQALVDMLHYFLRNFPRAILKDVGESPVEQCEERITRALKLLCKIELLEDMIEWYFPPEYKITGLITPSQNAQDESSSHGNTNYSEDRVEVCIITSRDPLDSTTQVQDNIMVPSTTIEIDGVDNAQENKNQEQQD